MTKKATEFIRTVGINIVIVLVLITILNIIAVLVINIYNSTKPKQYAQSHLFPNYKDIAWARQHFVEYDNLTKGYFTSFVGWRRPEYHGSTINIDENGLRRTVHLTEAAPTRVLALYGGSTMWGTGANDETTIPSFVAQSNPDYQVFNFGETGYVAHQSFNRFFESYSAGFRPDAVVFYDGVNDVWNRCRKEHNAYSHSREQEIRLYLEERREASIVGIVAPLADIAGRVKRTLASRNRGGQELYDCVQDPEKAEQIARNLLYDWQLMKTLVEGYGGTFVAILQPQAYSGESRLDHLELDGDLGRQYEAVYPRVIDLMAKEFPQLQENFVDLRAALDNDEYYYIDWCHLSPNGNKVIANRISERLSAVGDVRQSQREQSSG